MLCMSPSFSVSRRAMVVGAGVTARVFVVDGSGLLGWVVWCGVVWLGIMGLVWYGEFTGYIVGGVEGGREGGRDGVVG